MLQGVFAIYNMHVFSRGWISEDAEGPWKFLSSLVVSDENFIPGRSATFIWPSTCLNAVRLVLVVSHSTYCCKAGVLSQITVLV